MGTRGPLNSCLTGDSAARVTTLAKDPRMRNRGLRALQVHGLVRRSLDRIEPTPFLMVHFGSGLCWMILIGHVVGDLCHTTRAAGNLVQEVLQAIATSMGHAPGLMG